MRLTENAELLGWRRKWDRLAVVVEHGLVRFIHTSIHHKAVSVPFRVSLKNLIWVTPNHIARHLNTTIASRIWHCRIHQLQLLQCFLGSSEGSPSADLPLHRHNSVIPKALRTLLRAIIHTHFFPLALNFFETTLPCLFL